ncbi:MAG: LCP family protein [Clostridiaceae bacterium]|nr:LCP family protein [Clostridiaceae bacterium]
MNKNNDFSNRDDNFSSDFYVQNPDYDNQSRENGILDKDAELPFTGVAEPSPHREIETPLIREVETPAFREVEAVPQRESAPKPFRDAEYSNRVNNVQPRQSRNEPIDPARKAMAAARRAQEHANRAQMNAEREERFRRDEKRSNIPLVSPKDRTRAASGSKQPAGRQKAKARGKRDPQSMSSKRTQRSGYAMKGVEVSNSDRRKKRSNSNQFYPNHRNGAHAADYHNGQDNYPEEVFKVSIYGRIVSILLLLLSLATIAVFFIFNVLPFKYRLIVTLIIIILNAIVVFLVNRGRFSRSSRIGGNVIGTISFILIGIIAYFLFTTVGVLESIRISHETINYDIRVMKDSPLHEMADLNGNVLGVSIDEKEGNVNNAQDQICKQYNINFNIERANGGFVDNVNSLYNGVVDAILFNTADYDSIVSIYPDFEDETRILGSAEVMEEILLKPNRVNTSSEGFSMYISGIDTFGPLSSVSRSDVNIIVTVNPKTKKILMTTLPRDSYVEIYGTNGGYDKLTHAGIYGVETSINTIANFLQTDINYYSRVNFTSLIELVDVLGGIEVENPYAFPTNDGRYYFEEGTIYMDGDQALAFSRERYNLPEGDIGRGRNQMRVIEAMIGKVTRKENLINAAGLLTRFNQFAETNMPTTDIMNLVNVSLSGNSWQIEKMDLAGTGRMDLPSYGMPGYQLYMYDPDPESAAAIRQAIEDTLNAK